MLNSLAGRRLLYPGCCFDEKLAVVRSSAGSGLRKTHAEYAQWRPRTEIGNDRSSIGTLHQGL
jgi:hypothetical protein